ncbi:penicillin-binding transpeptidase domain-containing protein [uncultured Eubacterium sp.]|uniref:penicillin-binding transpeptidase domain-containing protein n=1 Tax=uncultured Eubacterium sp. TaxID=165185 RepID=UPI00267321C3|nr:penicillin-binding transpeptidase domain-containing protein [uncultured Eubacterium sp.]
MISDFLYTISKIIKSRIFIVSIIIIGLFSILLYRIFDLQIVNENYYLNTYIKKAEKTVYTSGTRGKILDVKGNVLAYDELAYIVRMEDKIDSSNEKNNQMNSIVYKAINVIEKYGDKVIIDFPITLNEDGKWEESFTSDRAKQLFMENIFGKGLKYQGHDYTNASTGEIINFLKNDFFEIELDVDDEMLLKIISLRYNVYANSYQKYVGITIAKDISRETAAAIYENEAELTGVTVEEQTVRKYNNSIYFAPILGYTGTISDAQLEDFKEEGKNYTSSDIVGKAGIESSLENYLQGKHGEEKIFVDNTGKKLSTISKKDAKAGSDVYLTIDAKLQKAVYTMLEKRIAAILISEIKNYDVNEKEETDEDLHYISVKKVYAQLVTNNVVSIKHLSKKSTDNEERVYQKYKNGVSEAVSKLKSQLNSDDGEIYNDLNDEFKEYYDYIYDLLKNDGILLTSSIDTKDETYNKYVGGKISMNEFIRYAIKQNWINLEPLDVSDSYLSTEETYDILRKYIISDIKKNTSFGKKVVSYRIYDGTISGSEICMLLYDQKVLKKDTETYNRLSTYDTYVTYQFIINQIKKLNITPAQLALDPCSGSVVITDPATGKVRALVTYPSYDNNMLSGTVDPDYWAKLVDDQSEPLYNRATQGASAPGSTFKMCTTMTALEEDVVGQYDTITDKGQFEEIKPSPKCWIFSHGATHGSINVMQALAQSCNYYFYEMGYRLGKNGSNSYDSSLGLNKMEKYATELGLNSLSGVEITEREPHFSTESAVHSAIGQGSNAFTPVQLARYVSTIANGGKNYSLTLVDKVKSSKGKTLLKNKSKLTNTVDVNTSTWDAIHDGMRQVITNGTVYKSFKDTKIKIAGKSGTAQENKKRNPHSLFVAYAPYNEPELATSVVIPFGNSSHDSAELAKSVIQYYYGEITDKDIKKEVKMDNTKNVTQD